ncbi:hypothetical protein D3C72_1722050 [compost metagenome]
MAQFGKHLLKLPTAVCIHFTDTDTVSLARRQLGLIAQFRRRGNEGRMHVPQSAVAVRRFHLSVDKYRYALIHRAGAVSVRRDQPIAGGQQKTPFVTVEIDRDIVARYAGSGCRLGFQCHNAAACGGERD